jgi:hypothetical protein
MNANPPRDKLSAHGSWTPSGRMRCCCQGIPESARAIGPRRAGNAGALLPRARRFTVLVRPDTEPGVER